MGAYVQTYNFTDGTTAYGSQVAFEFAAVGSSVNNIVNAQVANGAAIADSKLATISTANKVASTAIAGLGTLAEGDIIYASAADTLAPLNKGTDGQVLTLASGLPSWVAGIGSIKFYSSSWAGDAANADITLTGFGKTPKAIICFAGQSQSSDTSMGGGHSTTAGDQFCIYNTGGPASTAISTSGAIGITRAAADSTGHGHTLTLNTLGTDGATIGRVKTNTPSSTYTHFAIFILVG